MKKTIILFLVGCLVLVPTYASSLTDKKNQLSSAEQHIEDKQAEIKKNQSKQDAIQEEIKQVDLKMVEIQNKINELEGQLEEKKLQIQESTAKLEEANVKKDEQYEATKARMVQMYKNQKIGYIQVIFSSNNFWEAMNRVEYMKRISAKDNDLLDEYQLQIDTIAEQKKIIEEEELELDLLQRAEIAKNEELEQNRVHKQEAIERLAAEEDKLASEVESLEAVTANLKEEIQALVKKLEEEAKRQQAASGSSNIPTQYVGGKFMWPVPGYYLISSGYVSRTSPIFGTAEFHTGIDIPANYGEQVVAAADGVVITAGWVRGFGNTVMISHGSGLVTLYGHNSSVVVTNGQSVKKGQVVAKIGSTGYSTGNHCHFEVRVNGSHTDPMPYLDS